MADEFSTRGTRMTTQEAIPYGMRGHSLIHRDNEHPRSPQPSALSVFEELGVNLDIVDSIGRSLAALIEAAAPSPSYHTQFRTLVQRLRFASLQSSISYQRERQQRRYRQKQPTRR